MLGVVTIYTKTLVMSYNDKGGVLSISSLSKR